MKTGPEAYELSQSTIQGRGGIHEREDADLFPKTSGLCLFHG